MSSQIPGYAQCQGCRGLLFRARIGSCGCLRCVKCYSCAEHPEANWKDQPQIAEMVKAQFPLQVEALELEHEFSLQGPDRGILIQITRHLIQQGNEPARLRDTLAVTLDRQVLVCHAPPGQVFYPSGSHVVFRKKPNEEDGINHLHVLVMPREEEAEEGDDSEGRTEDDEQSDQRMIPRLGKKDNGYVRKALVPKCPDPYNLESVLKFIHEHPPHQFNREVGFKDDPQVAKWLALPYRIAHRRSPHAAKTLSLSGMLRRQWTRDKKTAFNLDRAYELLLAIQASCRVPFSHALWSSVIDLLKELKLHCSGVCTIPEVLAWMPEKL
jgi:hypothetical protein